MQIHLLFYRDFQKLRIPNLEKERILKDLKWVAYLCVSSERAGLLVGQANGIFSWGPSRALWLFLREPLNGSWVREVTCRGCPCPVGHTTAQSIWKEWGVASKPGILTNNLPAADIPAPSSKIDRIDPTGFPNRKQRFSCQNHLSTWPSLKHQGESWREARRERDVLRPASQTGLTTDHEVY